MRSDLADLGSSGSFIRLLLVVASVVAIGCNGPESDGPEGNVTITIPNPIERDLDAIEDRDTLVVLMQSNSTSYFLYRGEPMGFEYEFLAEFVRDRDLQLKTLLVPSRDSLLVLLNEGVGDVVAARLSPTALDSARVGLTHPLYSTRPVVVQRGEPTELIDAERTVDSLIDSAANAPPYEEEPGNETRAERVVEKIEEAVTGKTERDEMAERRDSVTIRARLITRPDQLKGRHVHVMDDTAFENRLVELSVDGQIYVVEVDSVTAEELTEDVAFERINYTISHENVARLQEGVYDNLVIVPSIDEPYKVVWAVRLNAPKLADALNAWIDNNQELKKNLYQKYFVNRKSYTERIDDEYLSARTGRLSPYDDLFREYAPRLGWDWRLLASQAFQESRFEPRALSWAGAMGLLQLMPGTARERGVGDPYDPEQNVAGAVSFLDWLIQLWADKVEDETERLKFILASYNAGPGHVLDARRLAEKHGGDNESWTDVAYWLLRKSEADVYQDPVVQHGFCRGLEPVTYVSRILSRYGHYRLFVDLLPQS